MSTTLTIQIGADQSWTSDVTDANGQPIDDLTGYHFALQVRATNAAATPLLDLSTENGKIVRGTGKITVTVAHDDSTGVLLTGGVFDTKVTDPLGNVTYPENMRGQVIFLPRVTP